MNDLKPKGIQIQIGGVERHFLSTLNVINEVQSHYNLNFLDSLNKLFDPETETEALYFFTTTLINDEVEREKWKKPDTELKKVSEKEVGWMIDAYNKNSIKAAILAANNISLPELEEDPNAQSGQQNN